MQTFEEKVQWCRKFHKAWTDGKPGPIASMEGQLTKHILPRLGTLTLDMVDETIVQEFVAELKGAVFERRRKNGTLLKKIPLEPEDRAQHRRRREAGGREEDLEVLGTGSREGQSSQAAVLHGSAVETDHRRGAGTLPRPLRPAGRDRHADRRGAGAEPARGSGSRPRGHLRAAERVARPRADAEDGERRASDRHRPRAGGGPAGVHAATASGRCCSRRAMGRRSRTSTSGTGCSPRC